MNTINVWPNKPEFAQRLCTVSATIELPSETASLWYSFEESLANDLTEDCDPFVVALMFYAMERHSNLHIHGTVSTSLLRNLVEFQDAWVMRRPGTYRKIDITVDQEYESSTSPADETSALVAFSGGVDSSFTVWRHISGEAGRLKENLQTALMVHGFDIPLEQPDAFSRASLKAKSTLAKINLPLITLSTNHKELNPDWDYTHILGLVSALSLFKKRFPVGVFGGTLHYGENDLCWGSNATTDHLLSSKFFRIVHDGAGFTRMDKIANMAKWQEAYSNLRLCYSAKRSDENCCQCWKCLINLLRFKVLGLPRPQSFLEDVSIDKIAGINHLSPIGIHSFEIVFKQAQERNLSENWVNAMDQCIKRNQKQLNQESAIKTSNMWSRLLSTISNP